MTAAPPRIVILAAVALALLGLLVLRDRAGTDRPPRTTEAMVNRINALRRIVDGRDEVAARYNALAAELGERFAGLDTYDPSATPDARAIEQLIRRRLGDPASMVDLSIVPTGGDNPNGGTAVDAISHLTFDISFATLNDHQALTAISAFARPESGMVWESLKLAADQRERKVTVAGKLAVLVIGPVE
jgi:hypothetical protein